MRERGLALKGEVGRERWGERERERWGGRGGGGRGGEGEVGEEEVQVHTDHYTYFANGLDKLQCRVAEGEVGAW